MEKEKNEKNEKKEKNEKNEKNSFIVFLTKNALIFKKYQTEITNVKIKDKINFQNDFIKGLQYYENCTRSKKELTEENKDKILQFIILSLLAEKANNTIDTSLDIFEIIAKNNYFGKELISKNINTFSKNLLNLNKIYTNNVKIILKANNLIKLLIENKMFDIKNESFYDIITFLVNNIIQIENTENTTSTYQIRKKAKSILSKCINLLISKSTKINYDFENNFNNSYYIKFDLKESLYNKYIKQIMLYSIDNFLEKSENNDFKLELNNKNEKSIDKGKYNWCFNCRNEANFFSEDLSVPICSKKCENTIKINEKLLNKRIYFNKNNYSIFDDYIGAIKIISFNVLYYLEQCLFSDNNISKDAQREAFCIDEKLNYFSELIFSLLSQPIIKDSEKNAQILELIKEYIFPFLFEISYFNKRANILASLPNNLKIFQLLINEFDDWYLKNLKVEIYTYAEKVIFPYFSKDYDHYDFENNDYRDIICNRLSLKHYFIELLSLNLKNFLFELNTNFDCDFYYKNIFTCIVKDITNIIYNDNNQIQNFLIIDKEFTASLKGVSFKFIKALLTHIEQFTIELNSKEEKEINDKTDYKKITEYINVKNILNEALEIFNINPASTINFLAKKNVIPSAKDFIQYKQTYINNNMNKLEKENNILHDIKNNKRYKYNLPFIPFLIKNENNVIDEKDINNIINDFFNINFSVSLNYDDFSAYILAHFIKLKFDEIVVNNKLTISKFFSSFTSYSLKALYYYINTINFKNYSILEALHLVFYYLPIINNEQIIEKIINIFCVKYTNDNFKTNDININNYINEYFIKLSNMIIEISFSIIKDKDKNIQKQIINKKLKTIGEYISKFKKDFEYIKDIEKYNIMNYSFIYYIYNLTLTNPINFYEFPNNDSLVDSNGLIKSNTYLYGRFPSELFKIEIIQQMNADDNDIYIIKRNMNKENLKNIINSSWGFLLSVFSKYIAYYNDTEHLLKGIENILIMGKACGMMKLYTISDVFLNCIINMTGLYETLYQKLYYKNILSLKTLLSFTQEYGRYICTSWHSILVILSRMNQLKKCQPELIYNLLNNKNLNKKKFIELYTYNMKQIELIDIETIYTITKDFTIETLKQFITDLIKVTEDEINFFKNGENRKNKERFFSFNKLVYIIDINQEKLKKKENLETYEKVKEFFVKLISENPLDDILLNKIKDSFKIIDHNKK